MKMSEVVLYRRKNNNKHYDIHQVVSNAYLLSDSTIADCFYYECEDLDAVQDVLDEIEEFSSLLPNGVGIKDLENIICGNKNTRIYGRAVCSATDGHPILHGDNENNRVMFASEDEAKRLGYRPCAKCLQDEYKKWKNTSSRKGGMI